jgi:hypothetical protein
MAEVSNPNGSIWQMANEFQLDLQDRVRACERIQREVGTCTRRTVMMRDLHSLVTLWKWD